MHNLDSGNREPAKDPKPNDPSRKRSLYGCLGAILLLVLILVLFGACAMIGGEEEEVQAADYFTVIPYDNSSAARIA